MKKQTQYSSPFFLFIFIAIVAMVNLSCKKKQDDPAVPQKQLLMTINFTRDYINPKLKAIVFISDVAGNPLADTMVAGNLKLLLYSKKTAMPPYQVTIVKWEPDMHNFLVTMNTWVYVMPGEWALQGNRLISTGDASFSLKNIPTHQGPVLSSNSGHANLSFATTGVHPVYKSPDDLFVKINTATGPLYKWTTGMVAGAQMEVDLATMDTATRQIITFPMPAQDFNARVYGYHDTDYTADLPVMTDEVLGDGIAKDNITVSYPQASFVSFHTYMEFIESWTSASTYTYSKYGTIPASFVKTGAGITHIQPDGSTVRFMTTGSHTITTAKWDFLDAANLAFDWTVYGPDTVTSFVLPVLPHAMTVMFPGFSLDSLHLRQFELTGYPAVNTYPAYLDAIFNPLHPGKLDRLEASSVKVNVN